MRQTNRMRRLGFFVIALMAVAFTFSAACVTNNPPDEYLVQSSSELNGCNLGAACTYPSFCWLDQTTQTGRLDCRQDTHTLGTSCVPGNYCDAKTLVTCNGPGGALTCDVAHNKLNVTPDAGAGGAGGATTTTTATDAGVGGSTGTGGSATTTDAGAGGKGGAATTTTTGKGGAGGGTSTCPATSMDVACVVGNYGCMPVNVSFCMDSGDDAGVVAILQCLCPNPNDGNKGTWSYSGSKCSALDLCWQPVQSDAGTGGAGGATTTTTTTTTTGTGDAGTSDAGSDAGQPDASLDAGSGDAGQVSDAGDAGQSDAGVTLSGFWVRWTPKVGYVQNGAVTLQGWYLDPKGVPHDAWANQSPICTLTPSNGVYLCSLASIPSGSTQFQSNVRHVDANSKPDGYCWVLDHSAFVPCGGNGASFGTLEYLYDGVPIPYDLVPNFLNDPLYPNALIAKTP